MNNTTNSTDRKTEIFILPIMNYWDEMDELVGNYDKRQRMAPEDREEVKYGILQLFLDSLPEPRFINVDNSGYSKGKMHSYFSSGMLYELVEDMAHKLMNDMYGLSPFTFYNHAIYYRLMSEDYLLVSIDQRDLKDERIDKVRDQIRDGGLSGDFLRDTLQEIGRANQPGSQQFTDDDI